MYRGPFMLGLLEPLRICGRAAALAAPTARLSSTGDGERISESAMIRVGRTEMCGVSESDVSKRAGLRQADVVSDSACSKNAETSN